VLRWIRRLLRRRPRATPPTITPRSEAIAAVRVDLAQLAPAPRAYLGSLGYLTLVLFENLGRAVTIAPTTEAKSELSRAAAEVLESHRAVVGELDDLGVDPVEAMDPFRHMLDDYQRRTQGDDWHEILVTCYLTAGFLIDFYVGLADGLPRALGQRVAAAIDVTDGEKVLVTLLREAVDASPRLASRLAMWGRRLIGDTMLIARATVSVDGDAPEEARTEPIFSELVAAHTRRMDALGLTA
jgi:hypothetical protein